MLNKSTVTNRNRKNSFSKKRKRFYQCYMTGQSVPPLKSPWYIEINAYKSYPSYLPVTLCFVKSTIGLNSR